MMAPQPSTLPALTIPSLGAPVSSETAVFQHSPEPDAKLKREWEPGCQPDEVYDAYLPPWRAWLRRKLVERLRREKDWMAEWQRRVRTEARDKFFYWTAIFGTHTFFMTFLPIFFFFGFPLKGRGMLNVVGMGIYISSFSKDLVCTPRPYSPPVIRLSMSTHHHEYGFPSSHSTNSVSIALFLGQWLYEARESFGTSAVITGLSVLMVYAVSVVGGRLYTGMHSTADIVGGSIMGIGCWLWWIIVGDSVEAWVNTHSWTVPAIMIPLTLTVVHYHPEPMDDCPCFEDAIAVLAVILGSFIGHWAQVGPSFTWAEAQADPHVLFSRGPVVGLVLVVVRLVVGLGILFAWRLVAKATLLRVLPPIFRGFSNLSHLELPTRRFYKPATDYNKVPPNLPFRTIPSVLNLQTGHPQSASNSPAASPLLSPQGGFGRRSPSPMPFGPDGLRARNKAGAAKGTGENGGQGVEGAGEITHKKRAKAQKPKYDAEVLTKVGVYSGIGFLATTMVPHWFALAEKCIFG
ncbi:hypothetical protein IAT38_003478 [Cryptococcus sp. DSM 104549]